MSRYTALAIVSFIVVAVGCASPQPVSWRPAPIPPRPTWERRSPAPTPEPQVPGDMAIHRRSEWANARPIVSLLDPMGTPTCITVHHEGNTAVAMSAPAVGGHLRAMRAHQIKTKASGGLGAGDIAYHFLIDPSGTVWEGRPMQYQGAHAGNSTANRANIGICLLGNFNQQHVPTAQTQSLQKLLTMLTQRYSIPSNRIHTHREVKRMFGLPPTQCPGTHLQAYMDQLRAHWRYANR
ncbi:MAG TPA: peptidoglycan recognition family protein [Planctomycetota bacterium]|nr:peptidoglycan recognition family protein [Planctomycetota bacterium]